MTHWIVPPLEGLIEPAMAPEFYTDGCGAIEAFGNCVRLHLYSEQMPLECSGEFAHKIVVVKIVRPLASLPRTLVQIGHCLWPEDQTVARSRAPFRPHLVE